MLLLWGAQLAAAGAALAADASGLRPGSNLQDYARAEAQLRREIETEIGLASCTQDAQCRALGLGAMACGGPEAWVAWSSATGRPAELQARSSRLEAMARERNRRFGLTSVCEVLPEPSAVCRQGLCVLRARPAAD